MDHNLLKRMAPMLILEILKAYTDEDHGLKVNEIVEYMESDYGVTMERKAVSRMLLDMKELSDIPGNGSNWKLPMGFTILCDERPRRTGNIRDNWRLAGEFEDAELRLLTDAVLAIRNYPATGCWRNWKSRAVPLSGRTASMFVPLGRKIWATSRCSSMWGR